MKENGSFTNIVALQSPFASVLVGTKNTDGFQIST